MNVDILQSIFFPIMILISYFAWRRYKDKDYIWIILVGIVGTVTDALNYLITHTFNSAEDFHLLNSAILIAIWISLIFLLVKIIIFPSKRDK